jgi:hypothetical protein
MKQISPFLLLLFLQLASTSPIPISTFFPSKDYTHSSYTPSQQTAFLLSSDPHTPPMHLTEPHFPSHQLSADDSSRPLVSSYILSLSSPSPTPSKDPEAALPAKPTSALGDLRKEDMRQYWESLQSPTEIVSSKENTELQGGPRIIWQISISQIHLPPRDTLRLPVTSHLPQHKNRSKALKLGFGVLLQRPLLSHLNIDLKIVDWFREVGKSLSPSVFHAQDEELQHSQPTTYPIPIPDALPLSRLSAQLLKRSVSISNRTTAIVLVIAIVIVIIMLPVFYCVVHLVGSVRAYFWRRMEREEGLNSS